MSIILIEKNKNLKIYSVLGLKRIQLTPSDIKNLDDIFQREILKYQIK